MSDIDLTEAVEAALLVLFPTRAPNDPWRRTVQLQVEAAAPLIEAQVREQVAAEIIASRGEDGPDAWNMGRYVATTDAAAIARGAA